MVWDPSGTGKWTTITENGGNSSDAIASAQGFFVERNMPGSGPTSLTFRTAGKLGVGKTGDVIGSKARGSQTDAPPVLVDLGLTVMGEADTVAGDGAKVYFTEEADAGWDAYEASQLPPPQSSSYVTLTSPLQRDEDLVRRLQASRAYPTTTDTITAPLSVRSVQVSGTAHLRWPEEARSALPDDWAVELEDTETGNRVNLRSEGYDFALSPEDGSPLATPEEAQFDLHVVPGSVIPVELAGLNPRTTAEETVRLTWQTVSEQNNAGFAVQRRVSGAGDGPGANSEWKRLGFVESKARGGTTGQPHSYRFTDADLPYAADSLTYRLRQVDTDGSAQLSGAVTVRRGAPERLALEAPFPNPTTGRTTLHVAVPEATEVQILAFDVLGRRVAVVAEDRLDAGRHELRLETGSWAAGPYFLRLTADGTTRTGRLTVLP